MLLEGKARVVAPGVSKRRGDTLYSYYKIENQ